MGWSCSAAASLTLNAIVAIQEKLGSVTSNGIVIGENKNAGFWETSRVEHADGAITGSVYTMRTPDTCRKTGSFRINANGSVARFPSIPVRLLLQAQDNAAKEFRRLYGNEQADRENVIKV